MLRFDLRWLAAIDAAQICIFSIYCNLCLEVLWGLVHRRSITESNQGFFFIFLFFFSQMWKTVPYARYKCCYHSSGMQPESIVVVPPFMSEVICICIQSLQKLSVSLMRSLMRLPPWTSDQGQGLRRIMKSPISSRSVGRFSLLHHTDAYRLLCYPTEQGLHSSGWSPTETLQINDGNYRPVTWYSCAYVLPGPDIHTVQVIHPMDNKQNISNVRSR